MFYLFKVIHTLTSKFPYVSVYVYRIGKVEEQQLASIVGYILSVYDGVRCRGGTYHHVTHLQYPALVLQGLRQGVILLGCLLRSLHAAVGEYQVCCSAGGQEVEH